MASDSFPPWATRVRNDPLGAVGYNQLIRRSRWAEAMFLREHLSTTVGSGAGEHNAAEVPREVGSCYITGGPTYNVEGFRHATGLTRPALGTFAVALDANVYNDAEEMAVQVQNTSERGLLVPCLSSYVISSTSEIRVYQQYLTSALGAGNAWAAEDDSFVMAVHSSPLTVGLPGTGGILKVRGDELSETSTDYNQQVQFDSDLYAKFLLDHSDSGRHTNREVARSWAHVQVNSGGGVCSIVATGTENPLTVARQSTGIIRVSFTDAVTLSAQPFVMTDYQRANSGAETDIYNACCPRSKITTAQVDVYVYKFDTAAKTWARADTDFFIAIYAGA